MGKNRFIVTAYFKGQGKIEIMVGYNLHYTSLYQTVIEKSRRLN